ncbi:hypothetical protein SNEBB_008652 [Seison nebaliae]|nr:hypothetical protein SNEBB_008652 [Seison nebaliae]
MNSNLGIDTDVVNNAFAKVRQGIELGKIKNKVFERLFYIPEHDNFITYTSSEKPFGKPKTYFIVDIDDIRIGVDTEITQKYEKNLTDYQKNNCLFSIVYHDHRKTLDLLASSEKIRNNWLIVLTVLTNGKCQGLSNWLEELRQSFPSKPSTASSGAHTMLKKNSHENYLRMKYYKINNSLTALSIHSFDELLKKCNLKVNTMQLQTYFRMADRNLDNKVDFDEFTNFFDELTARDDLKELLKKYQPENTEYWEPKNLKRFFREEQFEDLTNGKLYEYLEKYEPDEDLRKNHCLSYDAFVALMTSEDESIYDKDKRVLYQSMDYPLNDYYINSSHNTYLMGDQLQSGSSLEAYRRTLLDGFRCVEIDCHTGDVEPMVYHKYTLTSKITFDSVIEMIGRYAFTHTNFPLIISIENHCSLSQQEMMANILKEHLSEYLLTYDDIGRMVKDNHLPSPNNLRNKILLKAKRLPLNSGESSDISEEEDDDSIMNDQNSESSDDEKTKKKIKLTKSLSDLIYPISVHFHSFDDSLTSTKAFNMSSISEKKAFKMAGDQKAFVKHNQYQMTRIYPGAHRQTSSNLNPVDFWNVGCQIVAVNHQTHDVQTDINIALFTQNGNCGYVLKPEILRTKNLNFNSNVCRPNGTTNLFVKIISANHLPMDDSDVLDAYVKIEIYGATVDQMESKTSCVKNNGLNPIWDEKFNFSINYPELAFIRFEVKDHDRMGRNDLIAQRTIPLTCIQNGYRSILLYEKDRDKVEHGTLFVQVIMK